MNLEIITFESLLNTFETSTPLNESAAWDSIEKFVQASNQTTIANLTKMNCPNLWIAVDFVLCLLKTGQKSHI
jgi:hypothetical protein